MNTRKSVVALTTAAALLAGGFVALPAHAAPVAEAAPVSAAKTTATFPLPVEGTDQFGNSFTGTITQMRTYKQGERLMATGMISTVDAAGSPVTTPFTTQVTNVMVEGTRQTGNTRPAGNSGLMAPAAEIPAGCTVLHLELAPLQLDLLGLVVTLPNPLVIDITAVPGAGNLLGNLLCAVGGLLDQGGLLGGALGGISALLNRLLSGLGLAL